MSNAELWDLDTSGGIMEQIQNLVAPPISSEAVRRSRRRRDRTNYYRRPGRAVNHDCCDSCREGGDLLCCDRCPSAFHLLCHDPPLIEEELPPGEWLCHKCKIAPNEGKEDDTESNNSGKSVGRPAKGKRNATASVIELDPEVEHPLKTLAKAARLANPMQFDVGKEISCNTPLPGSSKRYYGRTVKNVPKKQSHELDNGLVPLPAKTCFSCAKSCRIAPLIQCDYCPLLFHLDCLNPPLTSLPTGRWMCPNHVEHFLDSHLLKSQSLTERLRLWDKYSGLVDSHTVKVDFLNKVHRKEPMFRYKRKLPVRPSITVPPAIKQLYKTPPSLLPEPQKAVLSTPDGSTTQHSLTTSLEEQEEWLSSVVSMQSSIAKYLAQKQLLKSSSVSDGTRPSLPDFVHSKPTASVAPVVQKDSDTISFSSTPSTCSTSSTISQSTSKTMSLLSSTAVVMSSSTFSMAAASATESTSICDSKQANSSSALSSNLQNGDDNGLSLSLSSSSLPLDNSATSSVLHNSSLDGSMRGAISLLQNHLTAKNSSANMVNGDVDPSTEDGQMFHNSDCRTFVRGRSNSVDSFSNPLLNSADRSMFSGDIGDHNKNMNGNVNNVLVSTLQKSGNKPFKVGTGVTTQTTKVILSGGKTSVINNTNGSNSTATAPSSSQRIIVQPSVKTLTTTATSVSGPKVYTVSTGRYQAGQLTDHPKTNGTSILNSSSTIGSLNSVLQQWIEGNSDLPPKIDEKLTQILAWQRLQQLMPTKAHVASLETPTISVSVSSGCPPSGKKSLVNGFLSQQGTPEIRARAMLCPVAGDGPTISMPYRCLTLGTGADMDVCLSLHGTCNFLSSHHASIFYDEMTRHFELLNYSEHGTTVDKVVYSCDLTDKPATTPVCSPLVSAVREVINKPRQDKPKHIQPSNGDIKTEEDASEESDKLRMSRKITEISKFCNCRTSASLSAAEGTGWEGSALLHHGSLIKLGCLQFIFSIADHAPEPSPPQPTSANPVTTVNVKSNNSHLHADRVNHEHRSSAISTTKFSSMPLLSSSPFLHQPKVDQQQQQSQLPTSLLKSQLRITGFDDI